MQMVGAFAEFERAMIRERTSAGLPRRGPRVALAGAVRSWMRPSGAKSQRASSPAASPVPTWQGFTISVNQQCHVSSRRIAFKFE